MTTTTSDRADEKPARFDLRDAVLDVLDNSSLADPGEIAEKVLHAIPTENLRAALAETLRAYVREVIRQQRNELPGGHQSNDAQADDVVGATRPARSWKRDGVREGWRKHLRDRYHVGARWVVLADMTPADLRVAAAERAAIAEANRVKAEQLTGWAVLVEKHRVARFADLPEPVLERALS